MTTTISTIYYLLSTLCYQHNTLQMSALMTSHSSISYIPPLPYHTYILYDNTISVNSLISLNNTLNTLQMSALMTSLSQQTQRSIAAEQREKILASELMKRATQASVLQVIRHTLSTHTPS